MTDEPIYVTRPALPPLAELVPYLEEIWSNRVLTNGGPFHRELEAALCAYLGVQHVALITNGTLALVTALQALRVSGEVVTTPYSFVATANALVWSGCEPVFADVLPGTLNIDPDCVERAITSKTRAIMPVHCYGNPCEVQRLQEIADAHGIPIIYDAAHAFAVADSGGSVLRHGDCAAISFHATKVFNTFEGGAIVCSDAQVKDDIDKLKNFGIVDDTTLLAPGVNSKMSEFNAALGLVQLKHVEAAIRGRREVDEHYRSQLADVHGIEFLKFPDDVVQNYSYMPVLVTDDYPLGRDQLFARLADHGIMTRRYFFPLITTYASYSALPSARSSHLPVASLAAYQILCLPIYPDLALERVEQICELIRH